MQQQLHTTCCHPSACNTKQCVSITTSKDFYIYINQIYLIYIKVTLEQAMKAQRGTRVIDILFLQPRH